MLVLTLVKKYGPQVRNLVSNLAGVFAGHAHTVLHVLSVETFQASHSVLYRYSRTRLVSMSIAQSREHSAEVSEVSTIRSQESVLSQVTER